MKNLVCTENQLSAVWFGELLTDWSKRLLGYQYLLIGHKVKKSIIAHTPTLGQYDEWYCLKIAQLNFTKLSVKFSKLKFENFHTTLYKINVT